MLTLTNADNITVASDLSFVVSAGKLEIGDGNAVTATAAELNYNDITTLGTAAASKTLTIKGDSTWTVAGMTCADLGILTTVDINGGSVDGATIGVASPATLTCSTLQVDSTVQLDGVAAAVFDPNADSVYWLDSDGLMKRDAWTDVMTLMVSSGNGMSTAAGTISVNLNDVSAAAVNVAADSIAIVDADDSDLTKKESIADLVSAMAGSGLDASAGVLSVQGQGTPTGVGNVLVTLGEGWTFGTTTLTASHNWTLPAKATATAGDIVRVKMPANMGGFEITITGSGAQTIDGQAALLPVEQDGAVVNLIYLASDAWGLF